MEEPGGPEIEGSEDSDGLKTEGKCRVKEIKRQAGGDGKQREKCEDGS